MYVVSFSYGGRFNATEIYVATWGPMASGGEGGPEKASGIYVILCRTDFYVNSNVTLWALSVRG